MFNGFFVLVIFMFVIGGAAAGLLKGRGALQDIDQMSLFQSLCKYCVSVTSVRDVIPALKYAIQEAQSGTPGTILTSKEQVRADDTFLFYNVNKIEEDGPRVISSALKGI